jgi:hypothetical protein
LKIRLASPEQRHALASSRTGATRSRFRFCSLGSQPQGCPGSGVSARSPFPAVFQELAFEIAKNSAERARLDSVVPSKTARSRLLQPTPPGLPLRNTFTTTHLCQKPTAFHAPEISSRHAANVVQTSKPGLGLRLFHPARDSKIPFQPLCPPSALSPKTRKPRPDLGGQKSTTSFFGRNFAGRFSLPASRLPA